MTVLAFIDCETTGLDPRIHQPYEVCVWREDVIDPQTWRLPHTLEFADAVALKIGGYHSRGFTQHDPAKATTTPAKMQTHLTGVTLVGSNPAFDAAMLTRVIGTAVWHHRMIDISNVAMVVAGVDRPMGLAAAREWLVNSGYDIPEPDHTAEGDVRATRAVYEALRDIRAADLGHETEAAE